MDKNIQNERYHTPSNTAKKKDSPVRGPLREQRAFPLNAGQQPNTQLYYPDRQSQNAQQQHAQPYYPNAQQPQTPRASEQFQPNYPTVQQYQQRYEQTAFPGQFKGNPLYTQQSVAQQRAEQMKKPTNGATAETPTQKKAPAPARMPKAQAQKIANRMKNGIVVASFLSFGAFSALVMSHTVGTTATTTQANASTASTTSSSTGSTSSGTVTAKNSTNTASTTKKATATATTTKKVTATATTTTTQGGGYGFGTTTTTNSPSSGTHSS